MKKIYKFFLLLLVFTFLSTYSPNRPNEELEKNNVFFEIKKIKILNNSIIEKNSILEALKEIYGKNIFLVKGKDIDKTLKNINFLEKINVKKKYPDTIIIKIFETEPLGFIYKDKTRYVIDSSSNLLKKDDAINFLDLPKIFGDGAENDFVGFLNQLKNNKFPIKKITDYYYFQIGRWDLQLSDMKIIKLPHNLTDIIIKKSIELLNRNDFQNYKIIDLRVDGKIIVE